MKINGLVLALVSCCLLSCNNGSSNGKGLDEGKIRSGIVGAWEVESLSDGQRSSKISRPDPSEPYQNPSDSNWFQLEITSEKLSFIQSNYIFVLQSGTLYHVEGRKLVTPDSRESTFADFEVLELSQNHLILSVASTADEGPNVRFHFRRIGNEQLATKVAQELMYGSHFHFQSQREKGPVVNLARTSVPRADLDRDGIYEWVNCHLNSSGEYQFHFAVLEVAGNELKSASDTDSLLVQIPGIGLDLTGYQKESQGTFEVTLFGRSAKDPFYQNFKQCQVHTKRVRAELTLDLHCESPESKAKATLQASCLLRNGAY